MQQAARNPGDLFDRVSNAASFAFDGLLKPVIFRTNCSEAA